MNDLWPEVEKQTKFLKVIVATASANQADLISLTHAFLDDVLSSKLLETIIEKLSPLAYNNQMQQNPVYSDFVSYTVKLLLLGFESLPSKMDNHLSKVHLVIAALKELTYYLSDETKHNLEGLEARIKVG